MTENFGGDQLARGLPRAQFRTAGANVTQEKWDSIFKDDDEKPRCDDADVSPTGDAGISPRKPSSDA